MSEAALDDPELERIVAEEQACLERVDGRLGARPVIRARRTDASDYDERLLDLRDQIAAARSEDLPPLVQEMERLQALASRLREIEEIPVDRRSPYFGRLVLEENGKRREVLIGRVTYLDTSSNVRIVDWRDAPVSRLYYRYDEGDEYDEEFGGREVTGVVQTRRSLGISEAQLRRIGSPQGTFVRGGQGSWRRVDQQASRLQGGAGSAMRAEQHARPGKLGTGSDSGDDKTLKEVTALIDPRQFELITRPDAGLVVIQGGAGSGKTTIGLHRLAYLAFRDPRRFRPDRMLIIVFNDALVRYIAGVLPALGVAGVVTRTYGDWASRVRQGLYPRLPNKHSEDTPSVVTRLKKHPALLRVLREFAEARASAVGKELEAALQGDGEAGAAVLASFAAGAGKPLTQRFHALGALATGDAGRALSTNGRVALERIAARAIAEARDVPGAWAELLTDRASLGAAFERFAPGAFTKGELDRAHAWCTARCAEVMAETDTSEGPRPRELRRSDDDEPPAARRKRKDADDDDDTDLEIRAGVDGREVQERARLDVEDDTLLLLIHQAFRGHLTKGGTTREPIVYEHILVDEAQDLSPLELSVVLDTSSKARSVTLAGDVQQRMLLDNGFSDWNTVLGELGFSHVEIEPLKLSYRSTHEIIEFSRAVLGPLAAADAPSATRQGAPVEIFELGHAGDAAAFLGEALRDLVVEEPTASVAVVARFPEQADVYYQALVRAEVRGVRRVAEQDFTFKPGIDVTDVRQVKGLEFDYVVLVDVTDNAYPDDDESRHLLHIGATRAAHQLWIITGGKPSSLIPRELLERSS